MGGFVLSNGRLPLRALVDHPVLLKQGSAEFVSNY